MGDYAPDAATAAGGNRLVAILSAADRALLWPHLVPVELTRGAVLFEPGDDVAMAHLPVGGTLVSLVVATPDGLSADAATVGREGAIGGIVSAGHKPAFARAVVQIGGLALRIDCEALEQAKAASATLRDVMARYADCMIAQMLQSVACNALHGVDARLGRWLLMAHDRIATSELPLTQEVIAQMLGVQRTTVTAAARLLQERGMISYRRGRITVLDRHGLEMAACTCHDAVRGHYDAVLPGLFPRWND